MTTPTLDATTAMVRVYEGRAARLIDPAPLTADHLGHVWLFDGGASDLEAPYTCALCRAPKWRSYDRPCPNTRDIDAMNTDRSAWIDAHRTPTRRWTR